MLERILTPEFLWQVVMGVFLVATSWSIMRADLKNLMRSMDEERRLREEHEKDDDKTHHDLRDQINGVSVRVARQEGRSDFVQELAEAIRAK